MLDVKNMFSFTIFIKYPLKTGLHISTVAQVRLYGSATHTGSYRFGPLIITTGGLWGPVPPQPYNKPRATGPPGWTMMTMTISAQQIQSTARP